MVYFVPYSRKRFRQQGVEQKAPLPHRQRGLNFYGFSSTPLDVERSPSF